MTQGIEWARTCFLAACTLDVAVRKPGNVSRASPGHGMHAELFLASAQAAAVPMFQPGARVGPRIEAAMQATWAVAGCNTNLGILLLCAPVAMAAERAGALASAAQLGGCIEAVLSELDLEDARATYRAIQRANPGGLGSAPQQDVQHAPSLALRAAMALAAGRDSIARHYAQGYTGLLARASELVDAGFTPTAVREADIAAQTAALVQRTFLELLSANADSHIVRKHGERVAHTVMRAAQVWRSRDWPAECAEFAAWDESLKARRINPGTSADLTVATLFLAGLLSPAGRTWHGS